MSEATLAALKHTEADSSGTDVVVRWDSDELAGLHVRACGFR